MSELSDVILRVLKPWRGKITEAQVGGIHASLLMELAPMLIEKDEQVMSPQTQVTEFRTLHGKTCSICVDRGVKIEELEATVKEYSEKVAIPISEGRVVLFHPKLPAGKSTGTTIRVGKRWILMGKYTSLAGDEKR